MREHPLRCPCLLHTLFSLLQVPLNSMFGYSTVLRSNTQVGGVARLWCTLAALIPRCPCHPFLFTCTSCQLFSLARVGGLCLRLVGMRHLRKWRPSYVFVLADPLAALLPAQGKGEFSMEYSHHAQVTRDLQVRWP